MTDLDQEQRVAFGDESNGPLPEIYIFVNGDFAGPAFAALSQDGEFLAGHACSNIAWGWYDMGLGSERKHEQYRKRYPNGYALVWIPGHPRNSEKVLAAHAKHVAAGDEGTEWQRAQPAPEAAL